VFWGQVTHEENKGLLDLNARELATLLPLVALCFSIGIYPKPYLEFLHKPIAQVAERIQPGKFGPQTAHAAEPAPEPTPIPETPISEPPVAPDAGR